MMEIDQSISEEVSAPHTRQTTTSNEHILALSPAELPQSVLGKLTKPKRLTRHEEEVSRWLKTAEMNKSKLQRLTKDLCEEYDKHFESRHEAAQLKMDQLFRSDKLGNLRLAEVQAKVEGHFMADIRNETNLVDQLRSDMGSLDWEIVQVLTTELTFHGNQLREICWLSLDEVSKYLKEQETSINVFVLQNRKFNVEETAKREIRTIKLQAEYEDKCRAFIEQWKIRRMEYIISNPVMPTFPGLPQWQQLFELQRSTVKKIENIFAKFHKIPQQIPLNETSLEEVVQWTKANIDLNSKIEGLLRTFDNAFDDMKDEIGLYLDEERQTVLKLFSECEGNPEQLSATLNGYPTIDDVKKLKRRVIFDMKTFATQFQDYSALFTAYVRSMFNMWNENWASFLHIYIKNNLSLTFVTD